jgi:hypothetical protein
MQQRVTFQYPDICSGSALFRVRAQKEASSQCDADVGDRGSVKRMARGRWGYIRLRQDPCRLHTHVSSGVEGLFGDEVFDIRYLPD